jgi:hypothetical protein
MHAARGSWPQSASIQLEANTRPLPAIQPPRAPTHRSQANVRFDTWLGIDRCGQRLADEVRQLVAAPENAGLERVTVIAHSMGGEGGGMGMV